ncbi:hypothetical protein RW1_035_00770 [Rhodococcus wratislaviensis NBRC 100605]|uniref:YhcG PDDEXK nuclease domain-containing protein n=1 Tax=Rhodococcus wratislaviensis NBRC 100605 TaxID=1219028 RepID=X0Q6F4_RHOWR|nr:hypothetical protein RW1_035_00770 [Rhodococcus wratislaviensis NBRC 100605]
MQFFDWVQSRFVVVELKIGRFEPEYVGKLGFYVSWVDDNAESASIGVVSRLPRTTTEMPNGELRFRSWPSASEGTCVGEGVTPPVV